MRRLKIFLLFIVIVGIGSYLYFKEGALPVNRTDNATKIFIVPKGAGLSYVANQLTADGLIRNKIVFYIIIKKEGFDKKIQAGDFRLSPAMNAYEIATNLTHGTLDTWITIIEGMRKEEAAHLIAEKLDIPEAEIIKAAEEGYLFPDTYLMPRNATSGAVIDILTTNFNKKYSESVKNKARQNLLTTEQVVILASLVEREAKFEADRKEVASILVKRFRNGWPLNVDATIQYALGYQSDQKTWWKKDLTIEDLDITSPYNSYKNKGLPPTPISNPGLSAIEAVVNADSSTPNWFYVSDSQGHLHFGKTLEEHNVNIEKYVK